MKLHKLVLSPSVLSSTRRLQLPGPFIHQERIPFILLQLNPFLVLIISGQVPVVINMPQNGSSRPSSSQVVHEVLRKRSRSELMNRSHNQLLLSKLPAEPAWVIESGKMEAGYRDAVSVRTQCNMLQSPPWTHPLNHSVRKSG